MSNKKAKFVRAYKKEQPKRDLGLTKTGLDKTKLDRAAEQKFFKSKQSV